MDVLQKYKECIRWRTYEEEPALPSACIVLWSSAEMVGDIPSKLQMPCEHSHFSCHTREYREWP